MCGGGGGGGWGGIAGAVVGGLVGYMGGGGAAGALAGAGVGAGVGGAVGNAISPPEMPDMPILDIKGPASGNMGTGETGALVELGSDSAKNNRLSSKGTGSQASGSTVAGLGAGGLRI